MTQMLKVILVEDNLNDAELIRHELITNGYEPILTRVQTKEEFLKHLLPTFDIVLSEYNLPQFTGLEALILLKERYPDIPLIIITGEHGDEKAVEVMKTGAADYLLKAQLARFGQSVEHALRERDLKQKEREQERALWESEERFRQVAENADEYGYGKWMVTAFTPIPVLWWKRYWAISRMRSSAGCISTISSYLTKGRS